MGRWTQKDEDPYRLPEGMKRVAYDDYTETYYFLDSDGSIWAGVPGEEYGVMTRVRDTPDIVKGVLADSKGSQTEDFGKRVEDAPSVEETGDQETLVGDSDDDGEAEIGTVEDVPPLMSRLHPESPTSAHPTKEVASGTKRHLFPHYARLIREHKTITNVLRHLGRHPEDERDPERAAEDLATFLSACNHPSVTKTA
ncbi:hypothetical protein GLOTRDRAFT_108764 [Gloeophyllum trabeum ATCC 11539]|uniref:Uncharacterized protein n=1 Tax=Gloeophyllum trabeum (strain ATCC 11539 / FP-39264 / Madison 617) TaxID=670483 RepID=S7QL56_GLOTA|nr:uncharacterized protein GLOTRDRAFT_108764 [Gloeophyllum trabeum ATCC 11539]EPQ60012.1 hypothetical protein GLOTRDRAFT_108764 [Gloeophyllum trabeum ATCC 11539]